MEITVRAPARLHFGLFDLSGDLGRIDGSAGVAIDGPHVEVRARKVDQSCAPPREIELLAHGLADRLRLDISRVELEVRNVLPSHVGLGSHTQLALAVGTALSRASGVALRTTRIAEAASRGGTSGIGVHCFEEGGLVVDGGHSFGPGADKERPRPSSASSAPAPALLARYALPEEWRFVVVTPRSEQGASGAKEVSLFEQAFPIPPEETGQICRHVLLGMMPGAARGDAELLGRSITAMQSIGFKRFELSLQPEPIRGLVDALVEGGAKGAGLSSFGPTVFGLAADEESAGRSLEAAEAHLSRYDIQADTWLAAPDNVGAHVTVA